MSKTKEEQLEDYKVKFKKHVFSKSIKISLKQDKNILVTMPYYCPFKDAKKFLLDNFEKIKNFQIEEKTYSKNFQTKFDTLKIIQDEKLEIKTKNNIVYFYYPKNSNFYSREIQEKLKRAHLLALKIEAKHFLIDRLDFLAKKYDFKYQKVSLRNQKTRFGSCSFNNNINLNINLLNYDFDCIDYVLIHELCHTKIKNHSMEFWAEVEKYCPNYKEIRNKIKKTK